MANLFATCGHPINDEGEYFPLALRNTGYDEATDCVIAIIDYVVFCSECAQDAIENGDVLNTPEEEADWLAIPLC